VFTFQTYLLLIGIHKNDAPSCLLKHILRTWLLTLKTSTDAARLLKLMHKVQRCIVRKVVMRTKDPHRQSYQDPAAMNQQSQ